MSKYKGVIFDLDGTLLDTRLDIANAVNATLKYMGVDSISHEEIFKAVGYGVWQLIQKTMPNMTDLDKENGLKFFREYYKDHCLDDTKLYEGAWELIETLKVRQIPMAILTNKPQIYTDHILTSMNLAQYFVSILGAQNGYPLKPDTQGMTYLLEIIDCKAEHVLMVGDTHIDVDTAVALNMDCALFLSGYARESDLESHGEKAKFKFRHFDELREWLI